MFMDVNIEFNGNSVNVKSMIDTGNTLKEPITGNPVIIVQKEELKGLLPEYILENLEEILNGNVGAESISARAELDPAPMMMTKILINTFQNLDSFRSHQ